MEDTDESSSERRYHDRPSRVESSAVSCAYLELSGGIGRESGQPVFLKQTGMMNIFKVSLNLILSSVIAVLSVKLNFE